MSIPDYIQMAGLAIAILILVLQHKSSIRLQRENYRQQTQIELYKEIAQKINQANERIITASTLVQSAAANLNLFLYSKENFGYEHNIPDRAYEINNAHYAALQSVNEVARKIEQYLVVNPKLQIFVDAFIAIQHDIARTYQEMSGKLMESLPIETKQQQLLRLTVKKENVKDLEIFSKAYGHNLITALSYLHDLSCETQNLLLGKVFGNQVPRRQPVDGKCKVIAIRDKSKLEKYFMEETSWGKETQGFMDNTENSERRTAPDRQGGAGV